MFILKPKQCRIHRSNSDKNSKLRIDFSSLLHQTVVSSNTKLKLPNSCQRSAKHGEVDNMTSATKSPQKPLKQVGFERQRPFFSFQATFTAYGSFSNLLNSKNKFKIKRIYVTVNVDFNSLAYLRVLKVFSAVMSIQGHNDQRLF